ncbi:3-oxoacyl-[acyl-carrier-protein] synthase III C-terminal domain-containing protein [Chitinophaga solisilvae]|uniref:3-oxoacyl-[acyl-carrier-protein] synthase III C-terminal domain-containing protein n=1 Tax=Chitinophaga solisilvae TaxID=1233460 RepID=UPI00136F5A39|nr:3-oxoacyl-[acyl-carrier-protein] synthase III C-terminal domain-containing protein [Chitinophaga solisilvae]
MTGIHSIAIYTPGTPVSVQSLEEKNSLGENELTYFNTCGINTVYDAGSISSYALALGASEKLLQETGISPASIDLIIYLQSRMPEQFISSESTRLQQDIGAHNAISFAISNLGCADSSMALKLAKDHLAANRSASNVLICYGNKLISRYRFRNPVTIMGDGGVAALVTRNSENKIVAADIQTNGRYWDLFKLEYQHLTPDQYRETCTDVRRYGFELAIESKNRFREINETLLSRQGIAPQEVHHYLMQNISARAYEYYQSAFDIQISPVCAMNLAQYGHLGAGDIFLNYQTGINAGLFQKGEKVLIMNNSPVAAWSSVLIEV